MAGEIKPKPQVNIVDIAMDIGVDLPNSLVLMTFNKPIPVLAMSAEEAIEVGKTLIEGGQLLLAKRI